MVKINFEIMNKKWTLRVLAKKKYQKKNGSDSVAITYGYKRRIDVGLRVTLEDIVHELVHAYMHELCLDSTHGIKAPDLEEIFCEFLAKRGRESLDLADRLMEQISAVSTPKITRVKKQVD